MGLLAHSRVARHYASMSEIDPITRLNQALEGRYQIERELGQGGMATVYLARDLKHNRNVALKVLKPDLAAVVGGDRFLAEIQTTANLQHPHILPLFDSGQADKFLFYVMPYVEGETLRERIDRDKQLPVEEALRIATAIANALHTAHEQGVVHRDIKPGNVLMSRGEPLVADFGIALAVSAGGGGRLTETGLSLGTPYYMSPEQATGDQAVGPASDTFALACVLYEMLVGEPPYPGTTAQAVLGKIIQGAPVSATAIRKSIPANVDAAIRKALEKLPADRFTGAQQFARALNDPGFRHGDAPGVKESGDAGRWKTAAVGVTALAGVLAAALGWSLLRPVDTPVSRYVIDLPVVQQPDGSGANLALSPDGSHMVFVADGEQGRHLWYRRRDQLQATSIPGTEGAISPVFSPDGTRVAFEVASGPIRVVSLNGEPPVTVLDTSRNFWGLTWGPDGHIYGFTDEGLGRVPETGGEMEPFTTVDTTRSESQHAWPQALPNGRGVLFTVARQPATDPSQYDIAVADTETGEHRVLVRGVMGRYAASGHLVYVTQDGTLLAAPFDQDALEMGNPVALTEGVAVRVFGSVHLAVADDGTFVYQTGDVQSGARNEFVWVTRSGQVSPVDPGYTFSAGTLNYGWRLSPDDTKVVFNSAVEGNEDIRIKHLPDGPEERITFADDLDLRPFWSPDGQHVAYFSGPPSFADVMLWSRRADGTGDRVLLLDDERRLAQGAWSPDGQWIVLRVGATAAMGIGGRDIMAFRPGVDSAAVPLVASADFIEGAPAISPSGTWLAYTSNETGRREVFVRPFPDVETTRVRVSTDGGIAPVWGHAGRELFFVNQDRGFVAAQFDPASGRVLSQEILFTVPSNILTQAEADGGNDFYDVASDDEHFLMARAYSSGSDEESPPEFVLVQGFFEVLRERVPN